MKRVVAIVPARCGSKTIIKKNIYPINGKPMISYCLEALNKSLVDEYYVSTDCEDIANVSIKYGSEIIKRPDNLSNDSSPTIDTILHAINILDLQNKDIVITIQPTSPLIETNDINNTINLLENNHEYDSIISVVQNHSILWELNNNSFIPKNHNPLKRQRRQDMNKIFAETGSIYASTVEQIIKNKTVYSIDRIGYIEIPKRRSFEVDDYEDIFIIESIMRHK